jgi:hypothetical protein
MSNFILSDLRELLFNAKVTRKTIPVHIIYDEQPCFTKAIKTQCRECGKYTTNVLVNDAYLCTNCSQNAEE